ncbi:Coenzyme F420 hydrogenase/dehydrogenase, beta subunit C-terminal domain [Pseudarthrobacter siccitolerans]
MSDSIKQVIERGMCIGCGACGVATDGRVKVSFSSIGMYQADLHGASPDDVKQGSRVCPFSNDSKNEDAVAKEVFSEDSKYDQRIGRYLNTYTARVDSDKFLMKSSSGGMTSWLVSELLHRKEVDGVIHVGSTGSSPIFGYRISHSYDEVMEHRKSMYHSTTFDEAMRSIRGNGRTYVFVGVPCFVRGARLAAEADPVLGSQLKFFVGLVCGHMKGSGYAESLAWQKGVSPERIANIDFRIKDPNEGSRGYKFGVKATGEREFRIDPPRNLVGGNWGHSVFQPEACNFCDDVYAETADVALGDAWLPKFESDWRGSNVVVSRNALIDEIVEHGARTGAIVREDLDVDSVARAQAGNYRHRRLGLSVRLADDLAAGKWVPKKRVSPGYAKVSKRRREVIRERRRLSAESFVLFNEAKEKNDLAIYLDGIRPLIQSYDKWSRPSWTQRGIGKAKRLGWKLVRRLTDKS